MASMAGHISDEQLRGIVSAKLEITKEEQEHILNCRQCGKRFIEVFKELRKH